MLYAWLSHRWPRLWFFLKYHAETEYQTYLYARGEIIPFGKTLRKQKALDSVFLPIIQGQSVLEIGCDTGFFPLYAAVNGATRATGVDRNRRALAKAEHARAVMQMPQVDFLYGNVPEIRVDGVYDTVVFLSAIHYMFSGQCGNKVLFRKMDAFVEFISAFVGTYLLIEFVEPADAAATLLVEKTLIESGEYSESSFLSALHRRFGTVVDLGRTHYPTRRVYLAARGALPPVYSVIPSSVSHHAR